MQLRNGRATTLRKLSTFLAAAIIGVSLLNAVSALRQYGHWPVLTDDEWSSLDRDLARTKLALAALPDRHIEYRTEEVSDSYDTTAFYRLQYILAPSILLRQPVENGYVLVEFWTTKQVKPLSGLMLVEDFGHGLALYRRM
jgi:hypothetical protein